jgi:hypothetical protein
VTTRDSKHRRMSQRYSIVIAPPISMRFASAFA